MSGRVKIERSSGNVFTDLNDLLRGKVDKFSLDALVNMIAAAGLHVELRVRKVA